ncbi:MAG: four helix bundle protein [Planctomicrobium sp.]|mgnify:CR=1 FL=1|jgi:four helix bundle protein|nr:four helix bundle protein [Planctomicrobium sp.]
MFGFEKLDVWQVAIQYSGAIYDVTQNFPNDERFGLTNQLRRASVSVSSNIAEGSGRESNKDFTRFIHIAYGSLMETVSQLAIAIERQFLTADDHQRLYKFADRLAKMLSRLRSSLA